MQAPIQEQVWKEWENAYLQIIDRCLGMGKAIEESLDDRAQLPEETSLREALARWANGQLSTLQQLQQCIEEAGFIEYAPALFRQFALLFLALLQETNYNNAIKEQNGTKFMVYSIPLMLESIKVLKGLDIFIEDRHEKVKEVWKEVQQYLRAFYGNEK